MPIPSTIALAYCADDQLFAERIERDLGDVASFRHFRGDNENNGTSLSDQLNGFSGPTLLLVTDNFLRNPNCMHHGNRLLSSRAGVGEETLAILIDIERYDEQIGEMVQIPANVGRQADIMNYINHWQERYLDLRRQKTALSEEIGPSFDQYLAKIREISGQVNDFLHYLKDGMPLRLEEFMADRYRQFFIFTDASDRWDNFILPKTVEAVDIAPPAEADPVIAPTTLAQETIIDTPEITPEKEVADISELTQKTEPPVEDPEQETSAAATSADEIESLIQRSWKLADEGEWRTALDLLKSGITAYPNSPDLAYHLALLFATEADDETEARKVLDDLLSTHEEYHDALFLSGELYLAEEDYVKAREAWENLSDLDANHPDLNQELGLLLANQYPKEKLAALEQLRAATKAGSEEAEVYYHYGRLVAEENGQPVKAIKSLKKAVTLDPSNAIYLYELARQQHAAGHYKVALESYHLAGELDPSFLTAENESAFAPPAKQKPRSMTEHEAGALSALKENIAQLESLLQEREAAAQEAEAQAALALLETRTGHGKIALISGATSGIGLATARKLAEQGYRLIITGRRKDRLKTISKELRDTHQVDVLTLSFDLRDQGATQAAIDGLGDEWSSIDILINNAGKAKGFDPIYEGQLDHWNEMIDVNLKGLLHLTRAVTPGMVARKSGFVLNICSTAGKEVYPNGNVYSSTKFAVDALTKSMRLDLVEHNIRVGQICPAHVEETEFAEVRFDGDKKRAAKVYENFQPLTSPDVAETIAFMLSRPDHVNIMDVVLQGQQQASSTMISRSGRE